MIRNDVHISIIKLTSTKSWNKSFSFLQALANPAAFSEHQTTVSRKRLMPLNDVYFNMDNIPLFSKFRLLTFMQGNVSKSADLTLTRLFQFVFRFVQFCCLVYSLNATSSRFDINITTYHHWLFDITLYMEALKHQTFVSFLILYNPCFVTRSYDKQLLVYHCKYQFKGIKTDEVLWS